MCWTPLPPPRKEGGSVFFEGALFGNLLGSPKQKHTRSTFHHDLLAGTEGSPSNLVTNRGHPSVSLALTNLDARRIDSNPESPTWSLLVTP